jgi:hypothetical protein
MIDFSYLGEKIKNAEFSNHPFQHIYIEDFLDEDHFELIVKTPEIVSPEAISDEELINGLFEKGYKQISFPGAVTSVKEYLNWKNNSKPLSSAKHSACEGFGFVLRLFEIKSEILEQLNNYIVGEEFNSIMSRKFKLGDSKDFNIDGGIQKYLDGYEISPHPDTRKKALTFMVNINPSIESEHMNHHTNYMKLIKEREYIQRFWEGNPDIDRDWLPWNWLHTEFTQNKNNSIVIFSPDNNTFHSVKADYNHLITQRTQLYGNLWYEEEVKKQLSWKELDLRSRAVTPKKSIKNKLLSLVPNEIKTFVRRRELGKRNLK